MARLHEHAGHRQFEGHGGRTQPHILEGFFGLLQTQGDVYQPERHILSGKIESHQFFIDIAGFAQIPALFANEGQLGQGLHKVRHFPDGLLKIGDGLVAALHADQRSGMVIIHQGGTLSGPHAVEQLFSFRELFAFDQQQGQLQTGIQRIRVLLQIGAHQFHAALGHAVLQKRFGIEQIERHILGPDAQGLFQQDDGIGRLAAHQPDPALHPDFGRNRRSLEQGCGLEQGSLILGQQGLGIQQVGIGALRVGRKAALHRPHGHILKGGGLRARGFFPGGELFPRTVGGLAVLRLVAGATAAAKKEKRRRDGQRQRAEQRYGLTFHFMSVSMRLKSP